jgi:hypothetical protein
MIEFDETMTRKYSGKEAIKERCIAKLNHRTQDIPYFVDGLDIQEFTYGSKALAINECLAEFTPNIKLDKANSRIQLYDVTIDVSNL